MTYKSWITLLSKINDLKYIKFASKKKQNFMKFSFKMKIAIFAKKCKLLTLLINYANI